MFVHLMPNGLRPDQQPARESEIEYFTRLAREEQLRRRRERRRRALAALRPHGRRPKAPERRH
jgi:hypothetical protein